VRPAHVLATFALLAACAVARQAPQTLVSPPPAAAAKPQAQDQAQPQTQAPAGATPAPTPSPGAAAAAPPTAPAAVGIAPDRAHERLHPPRNWVQKTYDIQYTDVRLLAGLLASLLHGSATDRVSTEPGLRTITVGTTNPAFLVLAEETIKQYDVPPPNRDFEVTAYLLLVERAPPPDEAVVPDTPPAPLPAGVDAIAKSLQSTLGYTSTKLLDGAIVRSREGHDSSAQGLLTGFDPQMKTPATWKLSYQLARAEVSGKKNAIAIYGFQFALRVPTMVNSMVVWQDIAFHADVDITIGQPALVGHSKLGVDEKAIVVVLAARVME